MKAGFYWSYASRSLVRGGQRTLLAIFCIAVGVLAIVALQLVGNMVNDGLTTNVRAGNGGDISVRSDIVPMTAQQVSTTFDHLKSEGQISNYTAAAETSGQSDNSSGTTESYTLDAVDPANFPLAGAPDFVTPANGSLSSLLSGNNIVVTQALLTKLGAHAGASITIHTQEGVVQSKIVGVIKNAGLFQGNEALMDIAGFSALSNSSKQPITYPVVYVNVPGHTDAAAAAAKKSISADLPLATVTTTQDALQQNENQVQQIRYFLQIVGLLALLIGGVGIINTMQVLLRRRQTEIAMLKTAGYQRRDLYILFGIEAGLLGLIGGALGAGIGVGVCFLVKNLVENAFTITLPSTIDPVTVLSGVAIGFFTALIFGVMPIVQASQIRPIAVLRGLSERVASSIALSIVLGLLLAVLFFFLALSILQSVGVALGVVIGGGIFLVLLSLGFTLVALIIGHLPVPERFSLPFVFLIGGALLISGLITFAVPAFGVLLLAASLAGLIVVLLPRTWKANVKMALRNIGRQKARTSTTMVALFVGVFAIGLVLVLGQDIQGIINDALSNTLTYNSFVVVGSKDKAAVDQELSRVGGIKKQTVNADAGDTPIAINGTPIGQVLQNVSDAGSRGSTGRQGALFFLSGVQGYDLAHGQTPDVTIAQGRHDTSKGHALGSQDANTTNVLMPETSTLAPLNLKLGDQITLGGADGKTMVTVTIAGFYGFSIASATGLPIYADTSVVNTLTNNSPLYFYSLELPPNQADQKLQQIQKAVPSVQTFSVVDLLVAVNNLFSNIILLLSAVASLALVAGLIIIANAVALAMLERRRELGILKSVGYTSRSVLSEVLMENGVVGFTGSLLAMGLVTLATVVLAKIVFRVSLGVGAPIVLGIVLATAAICMLIASFVAWGATRVRPLEVLRYE
ncbi:MAG TPA: FtsX-like permease family protein [Ktedonobacterales bacterium]|nr:FtsX-like permease family protein [Ktedonobacterales bacterium]